MNKGVAFRWGWMLLLLITFSTYGQREVEEDAGWSLKERLYLGGGFGLNGGNDAFGNRYFYVGLNPIIGYMITQQFSAGIGLQWQHFSYPDVNVKVNQYGVSPFVRYNFSQLFAYAEYNLLNTPTFNNTERRNFDRLLVGLGYTQPLGRRGAINAMALYDLIYSNTEQAFASPWVFRVYFSF
jgi:hypothetical protein